MDQYENALPQSDITIRDLLWVAWRHKWMILFLLAASLCLAYLLTKRMKPKWQADALMIVIQRGNNTQNNMIDPSNPASPLVETPDTQISMLESDGMAIRTINQLKNDALAAGHPTDSVKYSIADIENAMTVNNPKGTNILQVSMSAENPEEAAKLANTVCKAMVQWKTEIAQSSIQTFASTLESRAAQAKKAMDVAAQKELQFKNTHHLVDLSSQTEAELKRFQIQQQNVDQLQQQVSSQKALVNALENQLSTINASIKTGVGIRDDTLVASLQTKLNDLEMQRVDAAQKYTDAYPGILPDLDKQILDVQSRLHDAIRSTLNNQRPSLQSQGALLDTYNTAETTLISEQAQLNAAVKQKETFKKATLHIPEMTMNYAQLSQASDLARSQYASAQALLNSTRFDEGKVGPNVQIMQEASVPITPFSPNVKRNMLLGGLAGVFLSFGVVLMLEQSDQRLRNFDDARGFLTGPIIGSLPPLTRRQLKSISHGEFPVPVVEACGLARAHLGLALRKRKDMLQPEHGVILITSAMQGEGKSLTAFTMAQSYARSGKSVILVDADIRCPEQNNLFNTAEPSGLANVIEGNLPLDEALVSTDIETLSVLHSGHSERNPSELFSQPQVAEIVDSLRKEADIVIIDSPACSVVADALFLAPLADTIFFVIGMGTVNENALRDSASELASTTPGVMVYFINRVSGYLRTGYGSSYNYSASASRNGMQRPPSLPAPDDNEENLR
jgi:capsular exopolysaccharide synthesis family protein